MMRLNVLSHFKEPANLLPLNCLLPRQL